MQGVWWVQSPESMGGYILKHKNDMHTPVPLHAEAI